MTSTPEPVWQELPVQFKRKLVGELDFQTRCSLRGCSKSDRDLVDTCPLVVGHLSLTFLDPPCSPEPPIGAPSIGKGEPVTLWASILQYLLCQPKPKLKVEPPREPQAILIVEKSLNDRATRIRRVFYTPKDGLQAARLVFEAVGKHEDSKIGLFELSPDTSIAVLISMAQNMKVKLKARKLEFQWDDHSLEYLECFDPAVLRELIVSDGPSSEEDVARLVATEQWRRLKSISIQGEECVEIPLEHFSNAEQIRVDVPELCEQHFQFIAEFRERNLPFGSFFDFHSRTRIRLEDVTNLEDYNDGKSSLIVSVTRNRLKVYVDQMSS